jgi:MFS family permease
MNAVPPPSSRLRDIPRGIWALGFVSMFMDISSEMIHALLPIYLVTVLGASMVTVGFIEGIAESTAMLVKIFSGALSDWLGRRKLLAVIGYGLAAFTKPVFPLAAGIEWIVTARFVDRIGKGIRGAPRDALIADMASAQLRGAAFGLRQSLDTVGAFLGPLLAIGLMLLTVNNFTFVFWIAAGQGGARLRLADAKRLPFDFWLVIAIASVLGLARFSEAFLVLRAQNVGMAIALVPVVLVIMNIVYALAAYPAGAASDRLGRRGMLVVGTAMLIVADIVFAFAGGIPLMLVAVVFWGLHMGLTQAALAALVADTAPADLRGTAFGMFSLAGGLALLLASVIAGAIWDGFGPAAMFLTGAGIAALALLCIAALPNRLGLKAV